MSDNEQRNIEIFCPACSKKITKEHAYCPHCGVKIDINVVEQQRQKSAEEAVADHIEEIEGSRVRPSWIGIILGGILAIAVILAVFTNAFGLYRTDSTSPLAVYIDAANSFLNSKSVSFTYDMRSGGSTVSGSGYFVAGKNAESSAAYITRVSEISGETTVAFYNGDLASRTSRGTWVASDPAVISEPLTSLAFPLHFFGEISLTWEQTFEKNGFNNGAFTANLESAVLQKANEIGLALSEKGLAQLWELSERFVYKTLEARGDFDAVFKTYSRVQSGETVTYSYTLDTSAMLNRYAIFVKGAGMAPGYNQMRKDLGDFASTVSPGGDAYDVMDIIHQKLIPDAREFGEIEISVTVGRRDRALHSLMIRCPNLDIEYGLTVLDRNNVTVDTETMEAIFAEIGPLVKVSG